MKRISMVLILLTLIACATPNLDKCTSLLEVSNDTKDLSPQISIDIAYSNYSTLKNYNEEWKFNKKDKYMPPAIGISLSGGGTRSASFSIGVMKGLYELGMLENVDIISSVSGGGYALSWYYLQKFYSSQDNTPIITEITDKELFLSSGKFQNYLATHGELMGVSNRDAARYRDYAIYLLATAATIPVNLTLNGVFGLHYNSVPLRKVYQNGIERAYQIVPAGDDNKKINDHRIIGIPTFAGVRKQVNFNDLTTFIEEQNLPYFVINTTAQINDSYVTKKNEMKSRIFEFTPLRYGSDYYGHRYTDHPITFNKAISIAAAAVDSKEYSKGGWSMLASAANTDLGYYIENYNLSSTDRVLPRLLPFPFYLLSGRHQKDIDGTSIYLTDGGHAENLGAYSLIRRLTQTIIIVDAEHDPSYEFVAYNKLKKAVKEELGAVLFVQDIEDHLSDCRSVFGGKPVMNGTISSIPLAKKGEDISREAEIDVIYLKMSINETKMKDNEYPFSITNYYNLHKSGDINNLSKYGAFPQEATTDLTYDIDQFSAYRDLGFEIVMDYKNKFEPLLK